MRFTQLLLVILDGMFRPLITELQLAGQLMQDVQ